MGYFLLNEEYNVGDFVYNCFYIILCCTGQILVEIDFKGFLLQNIRINSV